MHTEIFVIRVLLAFVCLFSVSKLTYETPPIENAPNEHSSELFDNIEVDNVVSQESSLLSVHNTTHITSTTTPDVEDRLFRWNATLLTAKDFQSTYCSRQCRDNVLVLPRGEGWCFDVKCFPCNCDKPLCEFYGTCCPDYHMPSADSDTVFDEVPSTTQKPWLNIGERNVQRIKNTDLVCGGSGNKGYLSKRWCPWNYPDSDVKTRCQDYLPTAEQDIDTFLLVTDNSTGITYYNEYCATCNNVSEFTPWTLSVICENYMTVYSARTPGELIRLSLASSSDCSTGSKSTRILESNICAMVWFNREVVDTCNVTGEWDVYDANVVKACADVSGLVNRVRMFSGVNESLFKNLFCAICNMKGSPDFYEKCDRNDHGSGHIHYGRLPFSVLLDFGSHGNLISDRLYVEKCSPDLAWTSPDNKCLSLQCSPGKVLTNGSCSTALSEIRGLVYRLHIYYVPSHLIEILQEHLKDSYVHKVMESFSWITSNSQANFEMKITMVFSEKTVPFRENQTDEYESQTDENENQTDEYEHQTDEHENQTDEHESQTDKHESQTDEYENQTDEHESQTDEHENQTDEYESQTDKYESQTDEHESQTDEHESQTDENESQTDEHESQTDEHVSKSRVFPLHYCIVDAIIAWNNEHSRDNVETNFVRDYILNNLTVHINTNTTLTLLPVLHPHRRQKQMNCNSFSCIHLTVGSVRDLVSEKDKKLALIIEPHLNCVFVEFEKTEYVYTNDVTTNPESFNITLYFENAKMIFSDRAELNMVSIDDNGTLRVCLELLNSKNVISTDFIDFVKLSLYILTLICIIASIICLTITLMTYFMFPVLSSVAGKNNMFLCGSLLLAQISLLATSHVSESGHLCSILAISTHFLWLSMFCWCFTCCFHMFCVFSAKTRSIQSSAKSEMMYMIKRVVACSAIPGLIVIGVITTNLAISGGQFIGYGNRTCFVDAQITLIITLVVPLCLIILFNFIFFSITVIKIYNVRKLQTQEFRKDDHNNLYIYIKLSSMTGIFWVLSVISEATDNDPLRFISIGLNGLQGVFIFLSYTCNRRVLSLYLKLFGLEENFATTSTTVKSTIAKVVADVDKQANLCGDTETVK